MSNTIEINKRTNIVDESLMNGVGEQTQLFISINSDHFAYALLDKEKNKFVALTEYRFANPDTIESKLEQLQNIRESDSLLEKNNYSSVCIAVNSSKFALIPSHFYQKELERDILALTCSINEEEVVFSDQLKYAETHIIYALDRPILAAIGDWFDGAKLFFGATALIESQLLKNKNNTEKIVTVNVRMHDYDIVVTETNRLIFFNSFHYQTSEDFIYFILFTFEQLGLNPENVSLKFAGEVDKTSPTYFITSKYIRNISYATRPDSNEFSYGFDQLAPHSHYSLFNQPLCVS